MAWLVKQTVAYGLGEGMCWHQLFPSRYTHVSCLPVSSFAWLAGHGSSFWLTCFHQSWLQVKGQDIVGSMKADKQNLRMEELDLLFQPPGFKTTQ